MSVVGAAEDALPAVPPSPERVAARAIVLSAVSCRALIEEDAHDPGAEKLRVSLLGWLQSLGVTDELEPAEIGLLSTPLGQLDSKTALNASWRSEGTAVLAWALRYAELPPIYSQCEPSDVANALGFLDVRENTCLYRPQLRSSEEIERCADTYTTLHWRLRRSSARIDLLTYVSRCNWGPLRLDDLEIRDNDLVISGVPIDKVPEDTLREILSITQERHQSLNWLLGFERVYSDVTTDT